MHCEFEGTKRSLPFEIYCFDIYRINSKERFHICDKPNGYNLLITGKSTVSESPFLPCIFKRSTVIQYTGSIVKIYNVKMVYLEKWHVKMPA